MRSKLSYNVTNLHTNKTHGLGSIKGFSAFIVGTSRHLTMMNCDKITATKTKLRFRQSHHVFTISSMTNNFVTIFYAPNNQHNNIIRLVARSAAQQKKKRPDHKKGVMLGVRTNLAVAPLISNLLYQ